MKTETKRRLRDGTSGVLSGMMPGSILADAVFNHLHKKAILEGKLKEFTLEDLLDEVVERSRFWSNCAVGERFQVPEDNDGVWVQGKGWKRKDNPAPPVFMPFSPELVKELREFVGKRKTGRIFEPIYEGTKYNQNSVRTHSRRYAKMIGVEDWKLVHPHRFRHFGITKVYKESGKDVRAAKEFGRHKSSTTTFRYIQKFSPEERKETNLKLEKVIL